MGGGGQGGCERRIEVFVKIKKNRGWGSSGPAEDGGGFEGWGGGWLAAMFGVEGDVGYGGCEPRIEGIVQCTV